MLHLRFEFVDGRSELEGKIIPGAARRRREPDRGFAEEDVADAMLLRNVASGDKAAMHIMFSRHRAGMFCLVQRMVVNPAMVDDLVGHVFLDLWRSANRLKGRARVSRWMLAVARLRAVSPREPTHGHWPACAGDLSPAHREIIHLFYDREKSVAEISRMAGIPHAVLKSRLFYARKQLARILVSTGFEAAAVQPRHKKQNTKTESNACFGLRQMRGRSSSPTRNVHSTTIVAQEAIR
jgi:DNA-directed RNA polymerase specialized sigma24 family protein